uniref:Single-stranded DNA-binding protein n=1 Tax=Leersia perrieri TaxID=77586 RepID=A0A0D9VA81_9ORYZ
MRHLVRLLNHRKLLLLPSTTSASSAAAFSTSKRTYARRTKPAPATAAADAVAGEGEETGPGWQREKLPSELPRPSTIAFQPRVANAVRLIGSVGAPVQLQRLPDGRFSAVSVLVQDRLSDYPNFWIPIIFQDDLAQVAASHLKENDLIYVSGQLTGDIPPTKIMDGQANIQGDKLNKLWDDVMANPQDWTDHRPQKKAGSINARYPDFTHNVSKEGLWLNTAPKAILEKLDDLVFSRGFSAGKQYRPFGGDKGANWAKKSQDASSMSKQKLQEDLWRDLMNNPGKWWDNRSDRRSEKQPDFKHKDTGEPLWIGSQTPRWAIDALPPAKPPKTPFKGDRKQETLLCNGIGGTVLSRKGGLERRRLKS